MSRRREVLLREWGLSARSVGVPVEPALGIRGDAGLGPVMVAVAVEDVDDALADAVRGV